LEFAQGKTMLWRREVMEKSGRAAAGALGANAAENLSGCIMRLKSSRDPRCLAWRLPMPLRCWIYVAAATLGAALAWYGPEALLARRNGWHFSWRMPLLFVFRDLILPVIYIDAWITDELVWRGNEMTMHQEEPSVEHG
jgi:hypothetical protein